MFQIPPHATMKLYPIELFQTQGCSQKVFEQPLDQHPITLILELKFSKKPKLQF